MIKCFKCGKDFDNTKGSIVLKHKKREFRPCGPCAKVIINQLFPHRHKKKQLNVKLYPEIINKLKYIKRAEGDKTIQQTLTKAIENWFEFTQQ